MRCKNESDPTAPAGCLGVPDEQYTMDFTDVEPGAYIYWCSACGPEAKEMYDIITNALETRGPEFQEQFRKQVEAAERENRS